MKTILLYQLKNNVLVGFIFCCLAFSSNQLKSQAPVNNNCPGALPITIGTPPPCGAGIQTGSTATVFGNITNATPGNPYIYQTGCTGAAPTQNFPANDVWYTFVATGYQCQINIVSTFATPNVAFYSGNCGALGGGIGGCAVGAGGVANLTVNQLVPGTTYYLQVSGATGQIGTFTMNINNNINCASCVANVSITVNPLPVNGAYPPNTPVNFCFHVGQYNTINTNWLHGVQLTFGPCWNAASLVTNIPAPIAGAGSWAYYPAGIGLNNGVNWGPGWYFDYFPNDGNPKNNFGDSPGGLVNVSTPAQWNFCATIVTSSVCSPGCNLNVTFNTSADGESGSWSNAGCASDLPAIFHAIGSCCPPIMSSTPVACFGTSTGSAAATPVGGAGPYTYSWTGPLGYTFTANNVVGASTITNIPAGIYTVQIIDINLCAVNATVLVTQPTSLTLSTSFVNAGCLTNGSATVIASGGTPPYTYTWTPVGGNSNVASLPPGIYTVTVSDFKLCQRTATVNIIVTGTTSAAFTTPTYTQCLTGNSFVFSATVPGGTHTYSFNPIVGAPPVGNTANYGPVSFTSPGTYTVTHTIVLGACSATAFAVVVINPQPTVTANNNGPICLGGAVVLSATGGTSYSWSGPSGFTSAIQNPTINPVNLVNAGVYTVTATLNGCTGTATTNVAISTLTTSASNTGSYCAGATIQLNTPSATTYTWTGPGGFTSNLQNPTIPVSTPAMTGTYTVIITSGICSASATTNVLVNALPTPTALSNSPVCVGQSINLTGSGGVSYSWSGPGTFTSIAQNPVIAVASLTNAGTYTLTVTGANTCVNFTTTNVVVNPLPVIVVNNPFVCLNQSINLTSSGGGTYSWIGPSGYTSIAQNPVIPNATLSMSGGYTVTVTTALGCTNSAVANVTVGSLPSPVIGTNTPCLNGTLTFTGSGGGTYNWSGPNGFVSASQNPTIPNVTLPAGGIYTLIVTAGTCSNSTTASITINPLPIPNANSNSPVCLNNSIIFAGNGGTGYSWSGPGSYTSAAQNPTISIASATNAGTYTLTVTDVNSCVNFTTTNVIVNPLPSIAVNNPTVCMNQTINFTSNGGVSYSWSGPGGFTSILQNPNIANATLTMSGQYTVTVTSAAGCTNASVSNASVLPLPVPLINSNSPVCKGGVLNLNGSGANFYSWTGPNAFVSNIQNPSITNVPLLASGVYTLIGSLGTCTAGVTSSITINPLPVPTISVNSPICEGQTINLIGGGGTTYTWTGPGGYSSVSQSPSIFSASLSNSGNYALTVTDANNCVNSTTTNVVVNPKPAAIATGTVVCENTNATLSASGGISYSWIGPNGFTSNNQNPIVLNVTMANVGEYTVVVTSANTCTNIAATKLGMDPAATPSITTNSPVCLNFTLNLLASGAASYTWSGPNAFTSVSQNLAIIANSVSIGGVYTLTALSNKGCKGTATVNTVVNPTPSAAIAAKKKGCPPLCVTFTAVSSSSIQSCNWNFGNGGGSFSTSLTAQTCYNSTGFYDVFMDLTDVNGCKNSAIDTVEVYPKPLADFHYGPGLPIENDQIDFNDASLGLQINSWSWYFAADAHSSTLQNPKYIFEVAGIYPVALVISNKWNCKDTIVKPIVIGEDFSIYVPNAFTPNGDGINDTFQPKGHGIVQYDLMVFDRWGEKLFHTTDFFKGWDGIFKGELSKDDTYVWQIVVKNTLGKSKSLKGIVTLVK